MLSSLESVLLSSFTTRASFTWNNEKLTSTLRFSGKSAELTIRSPWKAIDAEYKVNGELKSFTSSSSLSWGDDKFNTELNFDIKNVQGMKTDFKLETPMYSMCLLCITCSVRSQPYLLTPLQADLTCQRFIYCSY